jgi:clan AA aspartic protease (TIGR02281 family)
VTIRDVGKILLVLVAAVLAKTASEKLLVLGATADLTLVQNTAAAITLLLLPPLFVLTFVRHRPLHRTTFVLAMWSGALTFVLPHYQHTTTPITQVIVPPAQEVQSIARLPRKALPQQTIALPYEGSGRRLSIPVAVGHGSIEFEFDMMLDTGATYTTLPSRTLAMMGLRINDSTPSITLHTANGTREAKMVVIDKLWLGNMVVEGVTIAICDTCEGEDTVGLLGLNVSNAFNLTIDGDARELLLTPRTKHDQRLDISPFTEIYATFSRYPNDEVRVTASLTNLSARNISTANIQVGCDDQQFVATIEDIPANETRETTQSLPNHTPCEPYIFKLTDAAW